MLNGEVKLVVPASYLGPDEGLDAFIRGKFGIDAAKAKSRARTIKFSNFKVQRLCDKPNTALLIHLGILSPVLFQKVSCDLMT